MKIARILTKE